MSATSWDELTYGTDYVFAVFANEAAGWDPSTISDPVYRATLGGGGDADCVKTQGYWKNHEEVWPIAGMYLGNMARSVALYDQAQLLAIFDQPVQGNGLVSIAHQLIATKLNIANGANSVSIDAAIAAADALIGALIVPPIGGGYLHPSETSALTEELDDYNNGVTGPYDCESTPTHEASWSSIKSTYR